VDDAALEKLHQDAVDGKLRGKRRDRGIGFEDSDSDDDDDVASSRKIRYKKRRVEGDTLDAIGK
jgi:mediator of replication checkpoint protein 1